MNIYLVEFFGTLFFAFVVFTTDNYLAIAAALAVAILIGSSINGNVCVYNPAITIAQFYHGVIPEKDVMPYILAEFAGALLALELSKYVKNTNM